MQQRRNVGFTYGCSSTRRIIYIVSNIFACFLSPDKLVETFPLQFCPHCVSWRRDMELARAWRIIFCQVTVILLQAAFSRQSHGERGRWTGCQLLTFISEMHPFCKVNLISTIFLSVWRFIVCWCCGFEGMPPGVTHHCSH